MIRDTIINALYILIVFGLFGVMALMFKQNTFIYAILLLPVIGLIAFGSLSVLEKYIPVTKDSKKGFYEEYMRTKDQDPTKQERRINGKR